MTTLSQSALSNVTENDNHATKFITSKRKRGKGQAIGTPPEQVNQVKPQMSSILDRLKIKQRTCKIEEQGQKRAMQQEPSLPLTLSYCSKASRSDWLQFRPTGEMFSMPVRNSMKVPLGAGKRCVGGRGGGAGGCVLEKTNPIDRSCLQFGVLTS